MRLAAIPSERTYTELILGCGMDNIITCLSYQVRKRHYNRSWQRRARQFQELGHNRVADRPYGAVDESTSASFRDQLYTNAPIPAFCSRNVDYLLQNSLGNWKIHPFQSIKEHRTKFQRRDVDLWSSGPDD